MGVRNLRSGLIRLRKELKLPATLKDAGVRPQELETHRKDILRAALADPCMKTNPVQGEATVQAVLEAVSGRG